MRLLSVKEHPLEGDVTDSDGRFSLTESEESQYYYPSHIREIIQLSCTLFLATRHS